MGTTDEIGRPDLSNWRRAPFNRRAFRDVRAILPTDPIAASREAWELPLAPGRPLDAFRVPGADGVDLDFDGFLRASATDAIVVLHGGRVVLEAYGEGSAAGDPHILMSATKAVIGLLVGILDERGDLDVDAPVTDHVPEAAAYAGATIRHLLDMRTGVVLDAAQGRAYGAAANWDPVAPADASATLHSFFEDLSAPRAAHGGPFRYVSANTDLLGWVIERAAGRSVATLLSTLLWQPMGAADDAAITLDRAGAARCTGGLCASARDLARLGQLVVDGGRRGTAEVVPETVDRRHRRAGATATPGAGASSRSPSVRERGATARAGTSRTTSRRPCPPSASTAKPCSSIGPPASSWPSCPRSPAPSTRRRARSPTGRSMPSGGAWPGSPRARHRPAAREAGWAGRPSSARSQATLSRVHTWNAGRIEPGSSRLPVMTSTRSGAASAR